METKPFSLQSPEVIAKDYGGNKQKIGQAAQLGVIDPTAAVLAGMFIDRMRAAQVKEQVPQQTIAQQVFAPPAPPMPPMGGAPPPPPPMPPMGGAPPPPPPMPPMGGAPPPPPMPPMGGAPPVGMAAGGFVGDNSGFGGGGGSGNFGGGMSQPPMQPMNQQPMNQQPMNQQFMSQQPMQPMGQQYTSPYPMPPMQPMGQQNSVNGYQGISAMTPRFADGGYVGAGSNFGGSNDLGAYDDGGMVSPGVDYGRGITALDLPDSMFAEPSDGSYANGGIVALATGGFSLAPEIEPPSWEEMIKKATEALGAPAGAAIDAERAYYKDAPERLKKQKREDMYMTLAQIGANMASTKSPSFLQAAGEAAQAALPGLASASKERRTEERAAMKGAADMERGDYASKLKGIEVGTSLFGTAQGQYGDRLNRQSQAKLQTERIAAEKEMLNTREAGENNRAAMAAASVAAGKTPDFMEQMVGAEYMKLKEQSDQGLLLIPSGPNRGKRYTDARLKNMAFNNVVGARYPQNNTRTPASIVVEGQGERPNQSKYDPSLWGGFTEVPQGR